MGSEGQGRAEERGGGRGESYDILWLQPPVPGRRLATPARRGQERAQRGLARDAARTAPAGTSQAGASRSLCFLCQQNTEAAGAGGTPQEPLRALPKAIACSPPQVCVPPRPLPISALPSLVLAGRAGAGAMQLCLWSCQLYSHPSSWEGFLGDGCGCLSDGVA